MSVLMREAAMRPESVAKAAEPLRVILVDDSLVIRGIVGRWFAETPDIKVVGSFSAAQQAIDSLAVLKPDVVLLDINMPDLDGLTALPIILARLPGVVVIMASTLTRRNAEVSLKALALGAADCLPKPEAREGASVETFRRELLDKVRQLGFSRRKAKAPAPLAPPLAPALAPSAMPALAQKAAPAASVATTLGALRPFSPLVPKALLIGSSTGGPQALMALMRELGPVIDKVPVIIVQHMPPTFTTILAEHLGKVSGRPSAEAVDGEVIRAGRIYLAPGALHLVLEKRDGQTVAVLDNGPPVNFCKPAVDPMIASATKIWGREALAVILTGMGADGMKGAAELVAAGGSVIAQDEASSVVWGMPGAVANAGLCAAILPLDQIGPKIMRLMAGGGR